MLVKNSDKIYRNHLLAILEPKIPKTVLFISGPPGKRGKRGRRGESGKSLFQLFCVIHFLARFPHLFLLISNYIVLLAVVCMCACVCVCMFVRCLYLLCYTQNFFLSSYFHQTVGRRSLQNIINYSLLTPGTQFWLIYCVKLNLPFQWTAEGFLATCSMTASPIFPLT